MTGFIRRAAALLLATALAIAFMPFAAAEQVYAEGEAPVRTVIIDPGVIGGEQIIKNSTDEGMLAPETEVQQNGQFQWDGTRMWYRYPNLPETFIAPEGLAFKGWTSSAWEPLEDPGYCVVVNESDTVTLTAQWEITSLAVTVTPPVIGEKSREVRPQVTVGSDKVSLESTTWLYGLDMYSTDEPDVTFEEGGTYYLMATIKAGSGSSFQRGSITYTGIDEGYQSFDGCTVSDGTLEFAGSRAYDGVDYLRVKISVTPAASAPPAPATLIDRIDLSYDIDKLAFNTGNSEKTVYGLADANVSTSTTGLRCYPGFSGISSWDEDAGQWTRLNDSKDMIRADRVYSVKFGLRLNEGYDFHDSVKAYDSYNNMGNLQDITDTEVYVNGVRLGSANFFYKYYAEGGSVLTVYVPIGKPRIDLIASKAEVTGITNKTYTGTAITQSPVVKVGGATLKFGVDYTVSYANNINVGTATMTITGKGNYTGNIKRSFTISEINDLPAVKITKPKVGKKKITVKWKKVSKKNQKKIQGIQIQIATDPNFEHIVKTKKVGKKKTSWTCKGLKSKTKYYVRIRAYKSGNHVSAWKSKNAKVK